ncbi:hypothetical protein [Streptomyces clavifer]|uniref:hypothetical protein n=1 Tax=Streptomyces clavifer TaxID=68188 RepID=UPI003814D40B
MTQQAATASPAGRNRKLAALVMGLAGAVVAMLCAFALPSVNSGPHHVPVGVTGPQSATTAVAKALDGDAWDVTVYDDTHDLTSAIKDRDVMGGIALRPGNVTAYTATAGGAQTSSALTATVSTLAAQQHADVTITDLQPFPDDDPRGAGFASAALPMVLGGMIPAMALNRLSPGRAGLRRRLVGALGYALVAGFALTALLQYGTGSLSGDYLSTSLGMSLGLTALVMTLLGLMSLLGMAGFGLGAAVVMLLGNPLSGLASGPHWLPDGWAALGQLLPPGATGSLLRANAFFDGTGADIPVLVLVGWTALGLLLTFFADQRARRRASHRASRATRKEAAQLQPA